MMNAKILKLAVLVSLLGTLTAHARPIVYEINRTVGTGSVVGTITTDGTLGTLTDANIIGFSLTIDAGHPITGHISSASGDTVEQSGISRMTATSTNLRYDFGQFRSLGDFWRFTETAGYIRSSWQLRAERYGIGWERVLLAEVEDDDGDYSENVFASQRVYYEDLEVIGTRQTGAPEEPVRSGVLDRQAPVADQIPFTFALGGASGQVLYQSLTVGLGGQFVELRLPVGCQSGEVTLQVFDANSDGLPITGSVPRLTNRFPAGLFPAVVSGDFHSLSLGRGIGVSPGERIVLVLSNPTGSCGVAAGVAGDGYLGGTGHADDTTDPFPPVPLNLSPTNPDDLPFQTFVRLTGAGTP